MRQRPNSSQISRKGRSGDNKHIGIHHSIYLIREYCICVSSIKMASKSWPFCPECRASLQVDATGSINCRVCPYESNLSSLSSVPSRTTYSADRAVPLWAKSDEEQAALRASKEPSRATVEEPCVRCGAPEVGFYTVQLRSVDEGQTVFYECPACKHTWSINN